MPYITNDDRKHIDNIPIGNFVPDSAGELQYVIAKLIHEYFNVHGLNYQHANNMMGALAGAQMELYARVIEPYEATKVIENGGVYWKNLKNYKKPLTSATY